MSMDLQSESFLTLLGEALRGGPGTPQWRAALDALPPGDPAADEYQRLLDVRRRLEEGRGYRRVQATAAFTRRLLERLDGETAEPRRAFPAAGAIAVAAAAALLILTVWLGWRLWPGPASVHSGVADLGRLYFVEPVLNVSFNGPLPEDWRTVGSLPLDGERGLRPATRIASAQQQPGGGLLVPLEFSPREPFAVDITVRPRGTDVLAELFVTDSRVFSPDRGTTAHELTWMMVGNSNSVVLPDGQIEATQRLRDSRQVLAVRIMVGPDAAIVESGGQRLWAGAHGLSTDQPRCIGVRFLRRGNRADAPVIQSLRILTPRKERG